MKKLIKYIITFIVIILLVNLFLFLVSLIPSSYIEKNVKESSEILLKEGVKPNVSAIHLVENDNYTDAIIINECYSIDSINPFFSYMSSRKNYKDGLTENQIQDIQGELVSYTENTVDEEYDTVKELNMFLNGKVTTSVEYARYWHGYLFFYRILLLFFNIQGIRIIQLLILIALFVGFIYLMKKNFNLLIAFIFGVSLITIDYFYMAYSLQGAPVMILTMIASIILLLRMKKIKDIYFYFFIIGILTNVIDYLTVPLISLGIPLLIYLLYKQKEKDISLKEEIKIILLSSMTWILGYSLSMTCKWITFDLIFHRSLIISAIKQVIYRTGNNISLSILINNILLFIAKNIVFIACFIIITLIITKIRGKKVVAAKKEERKKNIIPYLIVASFPIIWMSLFANHTLTHIFFVYRNMVIFIIGILISFKNLFEIK